MLARSIFFGLAVILLLFMPQTGLAIDEEMEKVVFYDGTKLYGKLRNNMTFEVSLFIKPYKDDESESIPKFWGIYKEKPDCVINELTVIIGGIKANIPKRAIIDLAEVNLPRGLYLMQTKKAVILYIEGGDGAGSYKASLKLVNNKLISRTIEFINKEGELDSITMDFVRKTGAKP